MYRPICQDCGWAPGDSKNGLGIAALHHDKTGHTVNVDVEGGVTYASDADHTAKIEDARRREARTG